MDYHTCEWCGRRSNYPLMNGFCSPKCEAEARAKSDPPPGETAAGIAGLLILLGVTIAGFLRAFRWGISWLDRCEERLPHPLWYKHLMERIAWNPLGKLGLPVKNVVFRGICHFLTWYWLGFIWIPIAYCIAAARAPSSLDVPQSDCPPVGVAEQRKDNTQTPSFTDTNEIG